MPLTLPIHARHPRRTLMLQIYDSSVETTRQHFREQSPHPPTASDDATRVGATYRTLLQLQHIGRQTSPPLTGGILPLTPAADSLRPSQRGGRASTGYAAAYRALRVEGGHLARSVMLAASACALRFATSFSSGRPHRCSSSSFRSWTVIGMRPARSRTDVGDHHLSSR